MYIGHITLEAYFTQLEDGLKMGRNM